MSYRRGCFNLFSFREGRISHTKERALSYAIGQLRVNSLTPSMSVPRQASKEGSGGERKASSQKQEA